MAPGEANAFEYDWRYRARPEQLPPAGSWRVWLLMAGRGFGKTRSGAEWVRAEVKAGRRRIALVGPTAADARNVMVEDASGILAISPDRERPLYEPSKRRLTWPNGAVATTYSADEPERLRGPQHDAAWGDELAAWRYPEAWDVLMFGMRLGADPRTVVTTTPRPAKLIRDLVRDPICVVTRGSSYENRANLAPAFFDQIIRKYEGTRLRPAGARSRVTRGHARRAVVARFDRGEPAALSTGDDARRRSHRVWSKKSAALLGEEWVSVIYLFHTRRLTQREQH
jgi:phage terminase large subunit-like protein